MPKSNSKKKDTEASPKKKLKADGTEKPSLSSSSMVEEIEQGRLEVRNDKGLVFPMLYGCYEILYACFPQGWTLFLVYFFCILFTRICLAIREHPIPGWLNY